MELGDGLEVLEIDVSTPTLVLILWTSRTPWGALTYGMVYGHHENFPSTLSESRSQDFTRSLQLPKATRTTDLRLTLQC